MTAKHKALKFFKKDEKEGIDKYSKAIKRSKGEEKETYKKILPEERKHLKELKQIK